MLLTSLVIYMQFYLSITFIHRHSTSSDALVVIITVTCVTSQNTHKRNNAFIGMIVAWIRIVSLQNQNPEAHRAMISNKQQFAADSASKASMTSKQKRSNGRIAKSKAANRWPTEAIDAFSSRQSKEIISKVILIPKDTLHVAYFKRRSPRAWIRSQLDCMNNALPNYNYHSTNICQPPGLNRKM